ncbi:MAG: c-type cytochrome, partial [Planctomycetales bacterium]|nr:c-type cytochrome [Planctomycetales bacterium]
MAAELLERAPDDEQRGALVAAFEQAFQGRSIGTLPDRLLHAIRATNKLSLALRLRLGEPAAIDTALQQVGSLKTPIDERIRLVTWLGESRVEGALPAMLEIVRSEQAPELLTATLVALQAFTDDRVSQAISTRYAFWPADVRATAARTLATRRQGAVTLLGLLDQQVATSREIPDDVVAMLQLHLPGNDRTRLENYWPDWQSQQTDDVAELQRVSAALATGDANPYNGHALFVANCAKCHQLFREGGQVGPNLTPYMRTDTPRLALQVVNPSKEIREGFETWTAITADGRIVSGFLTDQDPQRIVLRDVDGRDVSLLRSELESLERSNRSLMPQGLLRTLSEQEIRDLFSYLRISQPLNEN